MESDKIIAVMVIPISHCGQMTALGNDNSGNDVT